MLLCILSVGKPVDMLKYTIQINQISIMTLSCVFINNGLKVQLKTL